MHGCQRYQRHTLQLAARGSLSYDTHIPDQISQRLLDEVLWKSVRGAHSKVPSAGPHANAGG